MLQLLKTAILAVMLLTSFSAYSQKRLHNADDVTDVVKITILNPGVSYEKRIGTNQTLYAQAFMNFSFQMNSSEYIYTNDPESQVFFDPAIDIQYRYYYNIEKRVDNRKRTNMNSANYISAAYEGILTRISLESPYEPETKSRLLNRIGVLWGFQRNYKKRFSLDLNLGLGYLSTKSTQYDYDMNKTGTKNLGQIDFMGQFNIGFWLNKEN